MIAQKLMDDVVERQLLLSTKIDKLDLVQSFHEKEFYAEIYRQMALKVADHIFTKVGSAIDKAINEWKEENEAD